MFVQCSAVGGKPTLVNLQNAEGVGKPNIVGRKAKYCGKESQILWEGISEHSLE